MPYEYIKPNKPISLKENRVDDEAKIQDELDKWRHNMREERRRRLRAAPANVRQARNDEEACTPPKSQPQLPESPPEPRLQSMSQLRESARRGAHGTTALQEYRRELRGVAGGLRGGVNSRWYSADPATPQKHTKPNKTVVYHKAQSVLRGYIRRPTEYLIKVPKTPVGTLQEYKHALAISYKACRSVSLPLPIWHQRPLRSISADTFCNEVAKHVSVQTTRTTILRKKHTELLSAKRNCGDSSKMSFSGVSRNRRGGRLSCAFCGTPELHRSGVSQPEFSRRRSLGEGSCGKGNCFQRNNSALWRCENGRLTMQPSSVHSTVGSSLPPHVPCVSEKTTEYRPATPHEAYVELTSPAEVVVSPVTPISEANDAVPSAEVCFRRAPSPLLTDLLSKLALPAPLLYRPDLYQGHQKHDLSTSRLAPANAAALP